MQTAPLSPQPVSETDDGPGVPEALPRTLQEIGSRVGPDAIDCLWIFPRRVRGRREWGLVAASCFESGDGRRLVTARYTAERTGKGLYLETELVDEGVAPADRLPRVMRGVVRRGTEPLGSPRQVEVGGGAEAFESLMADFAPGLFEEKVAGPRAGG